MGLIKVLLFVGITLLWGCAEEKSTEQQENLVRPAKIVMPEASGENAIRVFPGTVEAAIKSDLAFRVGGQLEKLPALSGMRFKKGELLAELDDSEYRNTLQDREAKYSLAKSQYEKIIRLIEQGHVSQTEVDEAEATLKEADAALAVARDNVTYTRLLAPFDGVVANVQTENHQVVNANDTILQLRAHSMMEVRFGIPESLVGKLKRIEDPSSICAQVRFNAFPAKTFSACFKEYESTPDTLTRTYSIVHRLPEIKDFNVLPGMAVNVELDLSELLRDEFATGVLVPLSAVFEQQNKSYVWRVLEGGKVFKQEVNVSGIQSEKLLILEGLNAAEPIIGVGVTYIREGMTVRPMTKERGL